MLRKVLASIFVLTVLASLSQAETLIYVKVKGAVQGVFKGGVNHRGHENETRCTGVDDLIVVPRDPATGFPTGRPVHKPLKLTLDLDAAAPEFYNALLSNENLNEVSVEFWETTNTGVARKFYSIVLTNAALSLVDLIHPGPGGAATSTALVVELVYQKAVRTHVGGTTNIDIVNGG